MTRITKTQRKKAVRRAREQRQTERHNGAEDSTQSDTQDDSQDEIMQELADDAESADGSVNEDDIALIDNLPNELLNSITTYAVFEKTPVSTLRLVNKRFRDCVQSHLVDTLQAKVSR